MLKRGVHQINKKQDSGKRPLPDTEVRIDKWLKVARIFKTRSLAQEAIDAGHVKSGNRSVKPGRAVRIGDEFSVTKGKRRLRFKVMVVTARSVSAQVSHELYEILEDHLEEDPHREMNRLLNQIEDTSHRKGRPTKRERRQINKFTDGGKK